MRRKSPREQESEHLDHSVVIVVLEGFGWAFADVGWRWWEDFLQGSEMLRHGNTAYSLSLDAGPCRRPKMCQ
jgi:hypothetical protein